MLLRFDSDRTYKAADYLRLSKEDGDFSLSSSKTESNSIAGQRLLIQDYLKGHPEIELVREYCDDGYSGANFDRPSFQQMIDAVRAGEIDCIIVKDLSRFGREYIDTGMYIQKLFPLLGVRFIAINDHFDSANPAAADNEIVVPFKNLMNDSYCRDISVKVRTNLDAKRKDGQFVGSRVIYGYVRSPQDKNQLVIDPEAAHVVQEIFRWKIEGMSPDAIANRLNSSGVLSPIEYKRANGSRQRTCFQTKARALWSPVAIYRILQNEMYLGILVQGKTTTPNHKIKKRFVKDSSEWSRSKDAHEAIISVNDFEMVQRIMKADTRRPSGEENVLPLSGMMVCADCGSPMVRKTIKSKNTTYAYFVCSGNKADSRFCRPHRIKEDAVYETVLAVLQAHIGVAMDMKQALEQIEELSWEKREIKRIEEKRTAQQVIVEKNQRLKLDAYEDFRTELLSREEYKTFKDEFDRNIASAKEAIMQLDREQESIMQGVSSQQGWLAGFREFENIHELTRRVAVKLIDKIVVRDNAEIDVQLLFESQFHSITSYIQDSKAEKEAV